jgi:uncharacterized membrane protein
MMNLGPIELLVVEFPGSQFSGEITPALEELVQNDVIRIIDILFVQKDADGTVTWAELSDLVDDVAQSFGPIVDLLDEALLTDQDAVTLAESLAPGSSAGVLLFENVWATKFANAVVKSKGRVIVNERIPRSAVEELLAQHEVSAD